jgi:hypothetical protein
MPGALALEELLDGAREARVREPVRRERLNRHQAAEDLVLALGAALENLELLANGEVDRLVIAAFEMQQRHVLERTPIPAVQGLFVSNQKRSGHRTPAALCQHQHHVVCHGLAEAQKKIEIEVRAGAMLGVSTPVALGEEFPVTPA